MTRLTTSEWESLRGLVHEVTGIALSPHKKVLLVSRLSKRLKALGLSTFREYHERVTTRDPNGQERQALVNAMTTNKTEFYRESQHFEVLRQWLGSHEARQARSRGLRIWCAASSTGQEPYTIADVVRTAVSPNEWNATQVIATDVDTSVLSTAARGVYSDEEISMLPEHVRRRMFFRGIGAHRGTSRVRPELRSHVSFGQLNLIKPGWIIRQPIDIIFCRNVLIYFDRPTQHDVVGRMCAMLEPGGLLFLGHSEGLAGMDLQLDAVAHTVYRRRVECPHQVSVKSRAETPANDASLVPNRSVHYRLETGLFVLLIAPGLGRSRALQLELGDAHEQFERLVAALRRIRTALPNQQLVAKLIHSTTSLRPTSLELVTNHLHAANVEIAATRIVEGPADIRLDKRDGRLFVRRAPASSPRDSSHPDTLTRASVHP